MPERTDAPSPARDSAEATPDNTILSVTTLLANIGPAHQAGELDSEVVFSERGHGVAYIVAKDGQYQVVHNDKAGRRYGTIRHLTISPDGKHVAYGIKTNEQWHMVRDGREGPPFDDVYPPVFSPDSLHLAYTAQQGNRDYMVLDTAVSKAAAREYGEAPVFTRDSARLIFIEKSNPNPMSRMIISDRSFTTLGTKECRDEKLHISKDRSLIAAVEVRDGKQKVYSLGPEKPEVIKEEKAYDQIDHLAVADDGSAVAYVAKVGADSMLVMNGRGAKLPEGVELRFPPVIRPDHKGVGILLFVKDGSYLFQTQNGPSKRGKKYDETAMLTYSGDGLQYAYCARRGKDLFVVVNGKEGPKFDFVTSPSFSPDAKRLIYRARKSGKRFVVVSDLSGNVTRQHPGYEQVFDPVFTADGRSIAYGVKDGSKLLWQVERLYD
jgi:WD40 repeat protein